MKRVKLRFKPEEATKVADIIGSNGFITLLCYTVSGGIFDEYVECHLAIPSDKEDTAIAKFGNYIQKS